MSQSLRKIVRANQQSCYKAERPGGSSQFLPGSSGPGMNDSRFKSPEGGDTTFPARCVSPPSGLFMIVLVIRGLTAPAMAVSPSGLSKVLKIPKPRARCVRQLQRGNFISSNNCVAFEIVFFSPQRRGRRRSAIGWQTALRLILLLVKTLFVVLTVVRWRRCQRVEMACQIGLLEPVDDRRRNLGR